MLIDDREHLINLVNRTEVGRQVPIDIFRSGEMMTVYVNIVRRNLPDEPVAQSRHTLYILSLQSMGIPEAGVPPAIGFAKR